jgi:hypothetical protein
MENGLSTNQDLKLRRKYPVGCSRVANDSMYLSCALYQWKHATSNEAALLIEFAGHPEFPDGQEYPDFFEDERGDGVGKLRHRQ